MDSLEWELVLAQQLAEWLGAAPACWAVESWTEL
jgi:hypothetical protein